MLNVLGKCWRYSVCEKITRHIQNNLFFRFVYYSETFTFARQYE